MRIRTKIDVTYNDGLLGVKTSKIDGVIKGVALLNDFNYVDISYEYQDENGNVIHRGVYELHNEQIDQLSGEIFNYLPNSYNTLPERERMRIKHYSGFVLVMAQAFNIDPESDIEIIL